MSTRYKNQYINQYRDLAIGDGYQIQESIRESIQGLSNKRCVLHTRINRKCILDTRSNTGINIGTQQQEMHTRYKNQYGNQYRDLAIGDAYYIQESVWDSIQGLSNRRWVLDTIINYGTRYRNLAKGVGYQIQESIRDSIQGPQQQEMHTTYKNQYGIQYRDLAIRDGYYIQESIHGYRNQYDNLETGAGPYPYWQSQQESKVQKSMQLNLTDSPNMSESLSARSLKLVRSASWYSYWSVFISLPFKSKPRLHICTKFLQNKNKNKDSSVAQNLLTGTFDEANLCCCFS